MDWVTRITSLVAPAQFNHNPEESKSHSGFWPTLKGPILRPKDMLLGHHLGVYYAHTQKDPVFNCDPYSRQSPLFGPSGTLVSTSNAGNGQTSNDDANVASSRCITRFFFPFSFVCVCVFSISHVPFATLDNL